jgi:stringent starvation protein B
MSVDTSMTSLKPHLIRAFYEWIVENQLTPYVEINSCVKGINIPLEYMKEGKIVLNISPSAVKDLSLTNQWISFYARFSGAVTLVQVPTQAVLAIYAHENGQGTAFFEEEESGKANADEPPLTESEAPAKGKPTLTIVK